VYEYIKTRVHVYACDAHVPAASKQEMAVAFSELDNIVIFSRIYIHAYFYVCVYTCIYMCAKT
jgi:hypothetical protein